MFILSQLWLVWSKPARRWLAVIFSAVLFLLVHIYQGPVGAIIVVAEEFIEAERRLLGLGEGTGTDSAGKVSGF